MTKERQIRADYRVSPFGGGAASAAGEDQIRYDMEDIITYHGF